MTKLEIISELLVNELTDFEKDVTRYEKSVAKAEMLEVEFNVEPVKKLIAQLDSYASTEEELRSNYLHNLEHNLTQAKIYPIWALISFFVLVVLSCFLSFYTYQIKSEAIENEKEAYNRGVDAYSNYINSFFEEHPKAQKDFDNWKK